MNQSACSSAVAVVNLYGVVQLLRQARVTRLIEMVQHLMLGHGHLWTREFTSIISSLAVVSHLGRKMGSLCFTLCELNFLLKPWVRNCESQFPKADSWGAWIINYQVAYSGFQLYVYIFMCVVTYNISHWISVRISWISRDLRELRCP